MIKKVIGKRKRIANIYIKKYSTHFDYCIFFD